MARTNSVALVTGGANGIGRAVAQHLLDSGWCVAVID
ncbi:MAG: SDR family NAD(P)-dependent oxidoreductase, partial [Xanthobacteraceae bacterium]